MLKLRAMPWGLYLSGHVGIPRQNSKLTKYKKSMCLTKIESRAQDMIIIILDSIIKIIRGPIWPFNEYTNLHFDYEIDIHTSSKCCYKNGYGLNVDSLTILYWLHVSYSRSGIMKKVTIKDPSTLHGLEVVF